jgi:hypothetical protein
MRRRVLLTLFLGMATSVRADVGDPTVETDHPHYPGEGAFQTVEQCVQRATAGKKTEQEKAIALYLWILNHQYHLLSPQEWNIPGATPDCRQEGAADQIVADVNRARFSYGYALCGTVHAWNQSYWKALGMNARSRGFPGHTSSEIEYGSRWHIYDTDMAGLVFRRDGIVAGYDDVLKDLTLVDLDKWPLPRFPFAWPSDFNSMKDGFARMAKGGEWHRLYNSSVAVHPGIVHLRSGETFTRYFDRDHFGGADQRRFWHNEKGGPFRDWTFVNMGTPEHNGPKSNSRGNASYCNGEFIYKPDLAKATWSEGVTSQSPNVASREMSPRLHARDGEPASVTFQHFSPYVIAGKPADGANPMSKPASSGMIVSGKTVGEVTLEVSADWGQTWKPAGKVTGPFEVDLTEQTKGRYGWQVRFRWQGAGGLDAVTFTTITQASQIIYPRLKADGSDVIYRAAGRAVAPVLPNFGLPEEALAGIEEKSLRSANVTYVGRSPQSRLAYRVQNNKPGQVVFKIDAPAELLEVSAAAKVSVRVPTADGCDFHLDLSTDGGKTWRLLGKADIPKDNDASWGWISGSADVTAAKVKNALVRVNLYQGGYQGSLITAELYGTYHTPASQPMKLTYGWKEGGQLKTHSEAIPAETREHRFRVPTGSAIVDDFVRMEVP